MANTYRELLARAIERNGGYSRGYHDRWAISYTVGLYYADLDAEHIYERMCKEQGYLPPLTGLEWSPDDVWTDVQESLYLSLNDDDGNRTYGHETATRYGLDFYRFPRKYKRKGPEDLCYYPSAKPGWILVDPFNAAYFDVKFELQGRGGKHLVVAEFDGVSLKENSKTLAEDIRNDDCGDYPNKWCRKLLAMMDEWDRSFTSKNASSEMEYLAADRMYQDQYERCKQWSEALTAARARREGNALQQELQLTDCD